MSNPETDVTPMCLECGAGECCYVYEKGKIKGNKCTTPAKLNGMCATHVLLLHDRAVKVALKAGETPPPKPDLLAAATQAYEAGVDNNEDNKGVCMYVAVRGRPRIHAARSWRRRAASVPST